MVMRWDALNMKECLGPVLYVSSIFFYLCLPAVSQVPPSIRAAYLAMEAAQLAEEAVFNPIELPAAIRSVKRAEAAAQTADETALELDLGLLGDNLRMHPTLIRRQAKLVEIDAQRIMDEFYLD